MALWPTFLSSTPLAHACSDLVELFSLSLALVCLFLQPDALILNGLTPCTRNTEWTGAGVGGVTHRIRDTRGAQGAIQSAPLHRALLVTERLVQASMSTQSKLFKYVQEEKNILQDLHHPFIITMFAAFQDKETLYMVLEYVPGGDLFSFLQDRSEGDHPGLGETVSEPDAQIYSAELVSERCLLGG